MRLFCRLENTYNYENSANNTYTTSAVAVTNAQFAIQLEMKIYALVLLADGMALWRPLQLATRLIAATPMEF